MEIKNKGDTLEVKLNGAFNLSTVNRLKSRITSDVSKLEMNLANCFLLDSEAVIFMYKWQDSGKDLTIIDPPPIFHEVLEILEIDEHWKPKIVTTTK
jgi:anti-anti-sigma regulatory factor